MPIEFKGLPQPQPKEEYGMNPKKANEMAFYSTVTEGYEDENEAINAFNKTAKDLTEKGYSDAYENALEKFTYEQEGANRDYMVGLIEDPNVPKEEKLRQLSMYNQTGFISNDLKDRYVANTASLDNSSNHLEREAQDVIAEDAMPIAKQKKQMSIIEETDQFLEEASGELMSAASILSGTIDWGAEFILKAKNVIGQLYDKGQVDWNEVSTAADDKSFGSIMRGPEALRVLSETAVGFLKGKRLSESLKDYDSKEKQVSKDGLKIGEFTDATVNKVAKAAGLEEAMAESTVMEGMEWVGDKFDLLIDKIVEKKLFGIDNKEQATFAVDTVSLFAGPAVVKGYKSVKGRHKHDTGGPMETTQDSNPKAGRDMAEEALAEESGKLAESLGTSKAAIIDENVLPKTEKVDGYKPDINDGDYLKDHTLYKDLDKYDRIAMNTMYDDNIVNKNARLNDVERRVDLAKNSGLHYNQASSTIIPNGDRLSGTMVFGKSDAYPFTTKGEIIENGNNLLKLAEDMKVREIQEGIDLGLGTAESLAKEFKKNKVLVRDLKTNATMSLDDFAKTNFNRGKYQLELEFDRKYDLLGNQMLGESFANRTLPTVFGDASWLNKSAMGEHLFGTGFTAKWYEKARADLGTRAGVAQKAVQEDFHKLVVKNKDIKKEISETLYLQQSMGVDFLTQTELRTNFPHLNKTQIANLDATQTAWRRGLQTLHNITNQGEHTRLRSAGYSRGFFDSNGEYIGAVKPISKTELDNVKKAGDFEVFDPDTKTYRPYKDGDELYRMEGSFQGRVKGDGEITSDFIVRNNNRIGTLPYEVVKPIKGYMPKEYKSSFFIEVVPKQVRHNGKVLKDKEKLLAQYKRTEGTASTKKGAEKLRKQIQEELGDNYEVLTPRHANLDVINDHLYEYQLARDVTQTAKNRNPNMRTLTEDKHILKDPMYAFDDSARRVTRTATANSYEKAYKKKFMEDFNEVLPRDGSGKPYYPNDIKEISGAGRRGDSKKLESLEKEARRLWNRHSAFQRAGQVGELDGHVQSMMHKFADTIEGIKWTDGLTRAIRGGANMGLAGMSNQLKRAASLAYITYQMPVRHWIIQPMMYLEQSIINPTTTMKTMTNAPLAVIGLLNDSHPHIAGPAQNVFKMLPEKQRKELAKDIEIMKKEGILESIDLNLAASETIKGYTHKLNKEIMLAEKGMDAVATGAKALTNKMNKYGFAAGELLNRVALWMQTKERWIADPKNKGKKWDDVNNVKEISHQAWVQSGAMTGAGALAFQRMPLVSFLTQFQAITVKGPMNLFQKNATNYTNKERAAIFANRLAMHGMEYGWTGGGGYLLYKFLTEHEDPAVRENADALSRGYLDRMANWALSTTFGGKSDVSLSVSASLGAQPPLVDTIMSMVDVARFINGDTSVQSPNVASLKVLNAGMERVGNVMTMMKYEPLNPQTAGKALLELSKIVKITENGLNAVSFYALGQIQNSKGANKGFGYQGWGEAVAAMAGFKTRAELDQWKQQELQRDSDARIKDQIDAFDSQIMYMLKEDPENMDKFFDLMNAQHSALQQEGFFSPIEVDKILKGVMQKHSQRYTQNQSHSLIKWAMQQSPENKAARAVLDGFSSHPDPNIRDLAKQVQKSNEQLTKEINDYGE